MSGPASLGQAVVKTCAVHAGLQVDKIPLLGIVRLYCIPLMPLLPVPALPAGLWGRSRLFHQVTGMAPCFRSLEPAAPA